MPSLTLSQVDLTSRGPSGVRAQALDDNGKIVEDFVFGIPFLSSSLFFFYYYFILLSFPLFLQLFFSYHESQLLNHINDIPEISWKVEKYCTLEMHPPLLVPPLLPLLKKSLTQRQLVSTLKQNNKLIVLFILHMYQYSK